jgi:hypothetical protein
MAASAPAPAAPVKITPERAQSVAWLQKNRPAGYEAKWFQHRYGVVPPEVEHQVFSALSGDLRVLYLRAASESDRQKLWGGLFADRTPNQAVASKGEILIWVIGKQDALRGKALELLQPDKTAAEPTGLEWLIMELPREIPGLAFYDEQFLELLAPLEARVGLRLRGVYQVVHQLRAPVGIGRRIAQVEFWIPQEPKHLPDLVKALDATKTDEHAVLSGRGAAVVTVTRTDEATRILLDQLQGKGYHLESRVPSFASPSPTRPATPPKPPGR